MEIFFSPLRHLVEKTPKNKFPCRIFFFRGDLSSSLIANEGNRPLRIQVEILFPRRKNNLQENLFLGVFSTGISFFGILHGEIFRWVWVHFKKISKFFWIFEICKSCGDLLDYTKNDRVESKNSKSENMLEIPENTYGR